MSIYVDYAAATPVRKEVLDAMLPYFSADFANPSALHDMGRKVRDAVESARSSIKKILGTGVNDSIIFTASGTESINMALKGVVSKGDHIITTKIEHKAVLETCAFLEGQDVEVTYLDVDSEGLVDVKNIEDSVKENTKLITIHYANNEIGVIQPVTEIAALARKRGVLLHVDACQAGFLNINVKNLGVDLFTLNSSKIYGPKGIALLYVKEGIELKPLIHGGGQEDGLRSGTQDVAGIIGFAKALELAQQEKNEENERLTKLRNYFINEILKIEGTTLNGSKEKRLANNANITFDGVEGETLLLYLNQHGIYASSGSACSANEIGMSHVLLALGIPKERAQGTIRFTFGKETSKEDVEKILEVLKKVVSSLRKIQ